MKLLITLMNQLEPFIVEVRKSNGQEYKALSLYTRFCTLVLYRTLDGRMKSLVNNDDKNRKQSSPLEIDEIKFILNSPAVAVDNPKDDDNMQFEKLKEKNHAGGIKDLYTESGNSLILHNIPGNIYTLVANIRKYLFKCPNNAKNDYFFVGINTSKKVYYGDWYLISKLEKRLHDTMMHSICKDAKLDFKGCCITNYSMRSTDIHNLVELESNFYEPNSCKPDSCEPDSHKPNSCIALKDSTFNYINKGFFKASDLFSSKFNKKKTEVVAKAKVNNKPEADTKAKVDNELEAKASNKFKAKDNESKAQSDNKANSGIKYKKAKIFSNITIENCSNININISLMS
ncbi:Zinc finger MYM-type protein 2-like: PROVISIONAL [Gigaspora margarita]|uniref:Zinc finger MYM-type protein 2-like: PROVISIONAL n=1 Tax=Gigaspora margarita TaxID=4874 RepID=A0A8H3X8S7_GIGMA|nr:Zinc finger MYM-type protein 2-like: PROVISIONAL [Gigaspora margarita]